MSARVVNRIAFSEFRHIQSPIKLRRPKSPSKIDKQRIKKDLFGPFDRESSRRIIFQEIVKQQKQAEQKWGFDFLRGTPVDHSQYIWERVPPTIVPEMYTLSRAAHVRDALSCDDNQSERLLDERAAAIFRIPNLETETVTATNNKVTRTIQPKITDYLQERKRPSVNSVKRLQSAASSPAKKLRRALSMNDSPTITKQHKGVI